VKFDEMAARLEAVSVAEHVSEEEFRRAASEADVKWAAAIVTAKHAATQAEMNQVLKDAGVDIRNPGKVFDIGNVDYIASETDGKPSFNKITRHPDKETDFLKWFNHGGHVAMVSTGTACFFDSNKQVRDTSDHSLQQLAQIKTQWVSMTLVEAMQLQSDSFRGSAVDEFQALLQAYSAEQKLVDKYNQLVNDFNNYVGASQAYVTVSQSYINKLESSNAQLRNRPAPVTIPVLYIPQPRPAITCTGNALTYGDMQTWIGNMTTLSTSTQLFLNCQ
jgi:hypothetical protein